MRVGIIIGFLAVSLIGSSTDVKDPSDDFYDLELPEMFNNVRSTFAMKYGIPDMYELVLDQKLCGFLEENTGRGLYESFRTTYFDKKSITKQANYFQRLIDKFMAIKNNKEQRRILGEGKNNIVLQVEHVVPAQKGVCCRYTDVKEPYVRCLFGPEGSLQSFTETGINETLGSECIVGYNVYKGLCRKESRTSIITTTTMTSSNPQTVTPNIYNETLPIMFNEIRSEIAIKKNISNIGTLRSWVKKSKGIPGTGCDPGYKNFTGLCRKDSKTPDSIEKPPEEIQVPLDIDTLEITTTVAVTSTKEETLKPPIASTSDPSSPNNSSIIHGAESSEVTRIPLIYLRPTENPDLEKRLKKYLAEETDGDEPDDGDPLNEYEYYDYDSSSSISILVTVVFVCFFVFV
uniref:Secreted protein n=1 Tax=Caenorhabditis tropicalis TaxID=1561998 RepID=A0A1I7T1I4_9PELO